MFAVIAVGMPLTLLTTAQVAFLIRNFVQTEMQNMPAADSLPPFGKMHFITWGRLQSSLCMACRPVGAFNHLDWARLIDKTQQS